MPVDNKPIGGPLIINIRSFPFMHQRHKTDAQSKERNAAASYRPRPDYGGFAVLAYGAKQFFTVDSFYQYGHYRGASVADIASDKPKYKGTAYCASCHAPQLAEWANGIHNRPDIGKVVRCEVCHSASGDRDVRGTFEHVSTGPEHPKNLKMAVPSDTRQLCTLCHERMTGRPLQQRQIVVAEHAGTQQCSVCHNPHSPRLNLVSAASTAQTGDAAAGKAKLRLAQDATVLKASA